MKSAKRLGLLVLWLLGALLLAELLVRLLGLGPAVFAPPRLLEGPDKRLALECYPTDPRRVFPVQLDQPAVKAEFLGLSLDPSELARAANETPFCLRIDYNEQLRRGPAIGPRTSPEELRILILGDSFTEGAGVAEESLFTSQLERLLQDQGSRPLRVINAGRRGRNLPDLVADLEQFLPLTEPDLVIYAFLPNDFEQDPDWAGQQEFQNDLVLDRQRMGEPTWKLPWPLAHSQLARLLASRLRRREVANTTVAWYQGMTGPGNAAGWQRTQHDLAHMQRRCREAGARFAVAILPLFFGLEGERGNYPFAGVHDDLTKTLSERGIAHLDLLDPFLHGDSSQWWVHPVDMHPNAAAHERMAQALASFLTSHPDLLGPQAP